MVTRRDIPGRASHAKSPSYCDSIHTLKLYAPPGGSTSLDAAETFARSSRQYQSSPIPSSRSRTKSSPLKILARALKICRRGRNGTRSKPAPSPPSPRTVSPMPMMSVNEAATIRRILAVPSRSSFGLASSSPSSESSRTSLAVASQLSVSPSGLSRTSSTTYHTAQSFMEGSRSSHRRPRTAPEQHPYALAAPLFE
ncbi:hypothetical protein FRB90_003789 [Tulasnella sp. 427]|nr:hypothetical protein FRB90_003789 [Tulasnella sp. 427]